MGSGVTAGDIAARYGGLIGHADIPGFIGEVEAAQKLSAQVQVTTVIAPGEGQDPFDAEKGYRWNFFMTVGRHPTEMEIMGLPVWECDACQRLNGTQPCDEHRRPLGAEIPYPPRPWPSDDPGHIPGTSIIVRPGERRPNIVPWSHVRSVG
jgi:hypothetical protein